MICIKIAYLNWWKRTDIDPQDNWLFNFIKINLTDNIIEVSPITEEPDLLLCSCFGNINKIIMHPCKKKIFFYGENLARFKNYSNLEKLKSIFDLIIGFNNTNINMGLIHLPLWITYYDYYNMDNKKNIMTYLNEEFNKNKQNKSGECVLIARHDRNGIRTKIYNSLNTNGIKVDCPGALLNNCSKLGRGNNAKKSCIIKYKYNICPENSKAVNYHTEKIFQALESGCVPIYWAINKPEQRILRDDIYVFIDDSKQNSCMINKTDLNNKLQTLKKIKSIFNESATAEINKMYSDLFLVLKILLSEYL